MFENLFRSSGLSLDRIRSFCEIAGAGGMSKAARGDSGRQSQLSRQIKELEEFFGVELTARRGRNLVLTAEGERLALIGREALGAFSDFLDAHQGTKAVLTVGAGESFLQWLLVPKLKHLQRKIPNVVIAMRNLRSAEIVRQVQNAELDLGIVRDDLLTKGLGAAPIGVMRYALFVAKKKDSVGPAQGWRDALSKPIIGLEGEGQLMAAFQNAATKAKIEFSPTVLCSSMPAALSALENLDGVAALPEFAAPRLTAIDAPFLRAFDRRIVVIWNRRQAHIRKVVDVGRTELPALLRW